MESPTGPCRGDARDICVNSTGSLANQDLTPCTYCDECAPRWHANSCSHATHSPVTNRQQSSIAGVGGRTCIYALYTKKTKQKTKTNRGAESSEVAFTALRGKTNRGAESSEVAFTALRGKTNRGAESSEVAFTALKGERRTSKSGRVSQRSPK
jgi:hypothetical protein